ncbi:MAG: AI-2E family transporter [Lactobacillus sp.]|nr:AI-2E family transporter [Lactobacillus sp.]
MSNKLDIKKVYYILIIFGLLLIYNYSETIIMWGRIFVSAMRPLIIGALVAYLLNIIVVRLERRFLVKIKQKNLLIARLISIVISVLVISVVLYLIIKLIFPQVVTIITSLINGIPALMNQIQLILENKEVAAVVNSLGANLVKDFNDYGQRLISFATSSANQVLNSFLQVIGGATSALFTFVIAFSFAMYLLLGKERLTQQMRTIGIAFLPEKTYNRFTRLLTMSHEIFSSFFVGQTLEAIILGVLCVLGMLLFRFPFALTIGTFTGFTALVPLVGAWLGAAVGFLLIASQNLTQSLFFIVFIVVLQQIESNLIYPRVVGTSIGIPGIWVLVAITIGGGVAGILGMLIGVPAVATIYQVVQIITAKRLQEKAMRQTQ